MKDLRKIVGQNIKFYRKKKKLKQEQLCELIGITAPSLSYLENGSTFPAYSTLIEIIDKLEIRPYQLFLSDEHDLTVEDKGLQHFILEQLQSLNFEKRRIMFTIIKALSEEEEIF